MVDSAQPPDDARKQAVEALLQKHFLMVRSYLRHLLSSPADAEDVAQELCVMVLANPEILLRGTDPSAYLRGIARHMVDRHRASARRPVPFEDIVEAAWGQQRSPEEAEREFGALGACLEEMPERMRQIVDWRYRQGLNSKQIAERLVTSGDAVRMTLLRVRQALAKCMARRLAAERPFGA